MRPLPRHAPALLCLLLGPPVHPLVAQDPAPAPPAVTPAAPKPYTGVFDLTVSRADLPIPTFRYRFLPEVGELHPGDAAPLYLRLPFEINSERIREMHIRASNWLDLPLDRLPIREAEAELGEWSARLRQIEFGTRRETCRWEYPLREQADETFLIGLPDAQGMRPWGRLLALRARVEIAAGRPEQAIGTIETGIAFGRHIAEGPFYINKLTGVAIISQFLARADELIARPDAPNLYWALTALPRPLVGMREATEWERLSIGTMLTGHPLSSFDPSRPRADAEWTGLLVDLHARMDRVNTLNNQPGAPVAPLPNLDEYRRAMLPQCRDYLTHRGLAARTDDQALVLAIMGLYREILDDATKRAYLPFASAATLPPDIEKDETKAGITSGPAAVFFQCVPNTQGVQDAEARLDRRVAMLRTVEALRLHAARHDGQFPDRLDQVKEVPIPLDPVNGMPFGYRRDGATATLSGPPQQGKPLVYNLTLRP